MESYSSSSSSSSMYSSQYQQARRSLKLSNSFNSSLHSVRKSYINKPSKKPIAPLPPTPPRIYQVDPINFRDLVQKLTGAALYDDDGSVAEFESLPQQQPHRLHRVAPPPLDIFERQPPPAAALVNDSPVKTPFSALYREMMADTPDHNKSSAGFLDLNLLSPSSWCSFPLLSPGTLSTLDQSTVL